MSEVVIEDVGADAMQIFLEFIYGRDTSISDFDTACSVLAVADKYDVPGLLRSVRLLFVRVHCALTAGRLQEPTVPHFLSHLRQNFITTTSVLCIQANK